MTVHLRFCADPFAAPLIPLHLELHSACCRSSARYCTTGLANAVGGARNELARCCSRNNPTPLSNAYFVKALSLLPGPGEG